MTQISTQIEIFGPQSASGEDLKGPFKFPKILPKDPLGGLGVLESISGGFSGCNILKWPPDKGFQKKQHCLTPDLPLFTTIFEIFGFALSYG